MIVARTRKDLSAALQAHREGTSVLVPTMGFLHDGHLSLVDRARALGDVVAVSIFVNPLQFGPSEDFSRYPRDEERDLALLEEHGATLVFVPSVEEMYPAGEPVVTVSPGALAERLCGAYRPGHFRGVLTVVARLFGLFHPDVAVFGRKDFQQAVLIRRMVSDLELGVRIETGAIVREPDGLALSSRNVYLSTEERAQATGLHAALCAARDLFAEGERSAARLLEAVRGEIDERPRLRLQYAELVDPDSLEGVDPVADDSVLALAAYCGETRLIDNMEIGGASA